MIRLSFFIAVLLLSGCDMFAKDTQATNENTAAPKPVEPQKPPPKTFYLAHLDESTLLQIMQTHPDVLKVVRSKDFEDWAKSQDSTIQELLAGTDVIKINAVLTLYKDAEPLAEIAIPEIPPSEQQTTAQLPTMPEGSQARAPNGIRAATTDSEGNLVYLDANGRVVKP